MRSALLAKHLQKRELLAELAGDRAEEVVVGVGRDPEDARHTCILLYVPPEFDHPVPQWVTVAGERVRVVARERGGELLAYTW
jgi:hypothetical protein